MFIAEVIEAFLEFANYVLKREGHGHMLCSAKQIDFWRRSFSARVEEVEESAGKMEVFDLDQTPFFYSREHGIYLQDPRSKRLLRKNVMEQAMYFKRKGLRLNSILTRVSNGASSDIKSTHPGRTSQMSIVSCLMQNERIFQSGFSASGFKALFSLEQKNMVWVEDIICKSTLSGGMAV